MNTAIEVFLNQKERITSVILSLVYGRGFEPPTYRLGEKSSLKKCRKGAGSHTTLLKTHSLTHSPEAAVPPSQKVAIALGDCYCIMNLD